MLLSAGCCFAHGMGRTGKSDPKRFQLTIFEDFRVGRYNIVHLAFSLPANRLGRTRRARRYKYRLPKTFMQPDTYKLMRTGVLIFGTGVLATALIFISFGGIARHLGPRSNLGWLSLMLAMGCLPTGLLTLLLATLKVISDCRR